MSVSSVCSLLETARTVIWCYARSFLFFFALCIAASNVNGEILYVGDHRVTVRLALTSQEQQKGLQGVTSLDEDEGMLFIFNPPRPVCMWMKEVPIDLDVGFFDKNDKLMTVRHMKAQTQDTHCSPSPAKWALEVSHGWFQKKRITKGTRLFF